MRPLVEHIKSKFVHHHRVLVITFTLTAGAHVQLIARSHARIVAKTRRESLGVGKHKLSLSLDPAHWPEGLKFNATPLHSSGPVSAAEGPAGADLLHYAGLFIAPDVHLIYKSDQAAALQFSAILGKSHARAI